jgi:DNA-binding MarR family transcriptional regulator
MVLSAQEIAALLVDTIPRVTRAIREEMRDLAHGKFTVPQFRILNHLRKSPRTNRDLSVWMGVAPPTMSRMIETLVGKGLIKRTRNRGDLRTVTLTLTPRGRKETETIRASAKERFAIRIRRLDSKQSAELLEGLGILGEMFP